MGAYKYYNPSTEQWEIVKSKSIIKPDGSLEYTPDDIKAIDDKIDNLTTDKVDKVAGKQLSTEDYTTTEKNKLSGISAGANNYTHPGSGTNPHGTTKANVGLGSVDNLKQMPIAGSTFTGVAVAQNNTSYTTKQLRNVILSTANPSGGSNGDVWIKYTP